MNALLVDVGNSRVKWRLDDTNAPPSATGDFEAVPIDALDPMRDAWRRHATERVEIVAISAVASEAVEAEVERAVAATWPAARLERIVASARRAGVVNGYRHPAQLGPDRWLALLGAHAASPGRSLLVCGFGTATTIDLLAWDGSVATFVGGMILPGVDAMRRALIAGTARLPDRRGVAVDFADNTDDAIETGLATAQAGAVERAWHAAATRLGGEAPLCVLSGGAATAISPVLAACGIEFRLVPDTVLRGLAICAREALAPPSNG
jgi:type III pantothenate kinase